MMSSRQLVAAVIAVLAAVAVAAPVAAASASTIAVPAPARQWAGGVPGTGAAPVAAGSCGTANSLGLDAGVGGTETQVCPGTGPVFIAPAVGQMAVVMGPTIIGPAVIGVSAVSAGSVIVP
jgi:hypothetical protein